MLVDPTELSPRDTYNLMIRAITPRPIAWVSTISQSGVSNLAPFSFFSGVTASPPSVVFSPVNKRDGSKKDTVVNIEQTGEFVVNVVSHALSEAMNQTAAEYPHDVDEFEAARIETVASQKIKPHRVAAAPIQMECKLLQIVPVGDGPLAANLVIGQVLLFHVDDKVLDANGKIDPVLVDSIGRMGGASYSTTRDCFDIPRPVI